MFFRRQNTPRPWYKRKRFYVWLLLVAGLVWLYQEAELRYDDGVLRAQLGNNPLSLHAEVQYHNFGDRTLRYVELGRDSLPLVVFIHGAPASSAFWLGMMTDSNLLSQAKLVAVDRPGYGFSGFGQPDTIVKNQAAVIADLLTELRPHHPKIILHGSSYGGTVAARIAMDFPHLIDGLLLQSASLAPGEEKTYWITYPTTHWSLRWLVPGALDVANTEKLSHRSQLEAMRDGWTNITAPTIILHGTRDGLIYPSNAYYACDQLTQAASVTHHMVEGKRHDLLWTAPKLLRQSLLKLLAK